MTLISHVELMTLIPHVDSMTLIPHVDSMTLDDLISAWWHGNPMTYDLTMRWWSNNTMTQWHDDLMTQWPEDDNDLMTQWSLQPFNGESVLFLYKSAAWILLRREKTQNTFTLLLFLFIPLWKIRKVISLT